MKTLTCIECNAYLGKIEKGRIKKDIKLICNECYKKLKTLEDNTNNIFDSDEFNNILSQFGL